SFGVGVERTFPVHSPKIEKIERTAIGDVNRAKLYYLRGRVGKRARIREIRQDRSKTASVRVVAPEPVAEQAVEPEEAVEPELVAAHDETDSAQQELYLVLRGAVRFTFDDETRDAAAISVAAVPDTSVRRAAVALEPGATMLALGAPPGEYASTWRPSWFEAV